jgi:hypothetical protein
MMKIYLLFLSAGIAFTSCNQKENSSKSQQTNHSESSIYKLFPTKNYWTFIKLDTRNGKMWQVHFSVAEDGGQGQIPLNEQPLVSPEKEVAGRFTLYPTENIFNFILSDQIDGNVYQVQWSMEDKNRGMVQIK